MMEENLDDFFSDFGVTAVFQTESHQVLFNNPDVTLIDIAMVGDDYITYPSNHFSTMKKGDIITVGSVNYKIKDIRRKGDGKLTDATLLK